MNSPENNPTKKKTYKQIEVEREIMSRLLNFMSQETRQSVIDKGVIALSEFIPKEEALREVENIREIIRNTPQPPFLDAKKH
ncbi:MAG: hypothetical protein AAB933_01835 [Patescibacteria group bacterium]